MKKGMRVQIVEIQKIPLGVFTGVLCFEGAQIKYDKFGMVEWMNDLLRVERTRWTCLYVNHRARFDCIHPYVSDGISKPPQTTIILFQMSNHQVDIERVWKKVYVNEKCAKCSTKLNRSSIFDCTPAFFNTLIPHIFYTRIYQVFFIDSTKFTANWSIVKHKEIYIKFTWFSDCSVCFMLASIKKHLVYLRTTNHKYQFRFRFPMGATSRMYRCRIQCHRWEINIMSNRKWISELNRESDRNVMMRWWYNNISSYPAGLWVLLNVFGYTAYINMKREKRKRRIEKYRSE